MNDIEIIIRKKLKVYSKVLNDRYKLEYINIKDVIDNSDL